MIYTDAKAKAVKTEGQAQAALKVMHVLGQLGIGGKEIGVVKLANRLPRDKIVTSICSARPADGLKLRLAPGVTLHELAKREGNDLAFVYSLYRLLRRERPAILHTHSWGTLWEGLVAARLARLPLVVHGEHGTMETRPRNRALQRWAWQSCDRVLSVSSELADRMAAQTGFPRDRILTIRNGVDLELPKGTDRGRGRRTLGVSDGTVTIGTVARLVPVKAHEVLLRALSVLDRQGQCPQTILVGSGPLRDSLESLAAQLNVSHRVRFLGHRDDVPEILSALDIFVLPSHSEGLSNTILEAMAARLPVVATRVGGSVEVVHDRVTGLLVDANSPQALAKAIATLANDATMRATMGRAGRELASSHFGVARMIRDYEAMYLALARQRGLKVLDATAVEV